MTGHSPKRKDLIVFDFDGTLTTEDTFVRFMKDYVGTARWYALMAPLTPTFLSYKFGRIDRHAVKAAVVRQVFAGRALSDVQAAADRFAADIIPTLLRPDGLTRLKTRIAESQAGGPDVVICSASISPYLESFLRPLGVDHIVACELATDGHDMCTGHLAGINVWGEQKMESLHSYFSSYAVHLLEAYGDSAGDAAILKAADSAYWRPFRP